MKKKSLCTMLITMLLTSCSNYIGIIDKTVTNIFDEKDYDISILKAEFDSYDEFGEYYTNNLADNFGKNDDTLKRIAYSYKDVDYPNLEENVFIVDISDEDNFYYYRTSSYVGAEEKCYRVNNGYIFKYIGGKDELSLDEGNEFIKSQFYSDLHLYSFRYYPSYSLKNVGVNKYYLYENNYFKEVYGKDDEVKSVAYYDEYSNLIYQENYNDEGKLTFTMNFNRF